MQHRLKNIYWKEEPSNQAHTIPFDTSSFCNTHIPKLFSYIWLPYTFQASFTFFHSESPIQPPLPSPHRHSPLKAYALDRAILLHPHHLLIGEPSSVHQEWQTSALEGGGGCGGVEGWRELLWRKC